MKSLDSWKRVLAVAVLGVLGVSARTSAQPVESAGTPSAQVPTPVDEAGAEPPAEGPAQAAEVRPIEELDLSALIDLPVVTASGGRAQRLAEAAANVSVVTRDEIALQGWRSLAELLSNTIGVYVIDDGVLPSVGVRGVTGGLRAGTRIVKVMINGVPVNFRPDLTAFIGPEFIPMEAVERVEVARGPLSALYGANAFLAVVNVITRDPRAAENINGTSAGGRVWLQRNNLGGGASALASYGNQDTGLVLSFSADTLDRSGLSVPKTFPSQDPSIARYAPFFASRSENDLARPTSGFGQFVTTLAGGRFSVQGGLQKLDSMGEFQLNSVLTHRTRVAADNLWGSASYEREFSPLLSSSLSLGYSWGQPTSDERFYLTAIDSSSFERRFFYRSLDGTLKFTLTPSELVSVDLGVDYSREFHGVLYYTEIFNEPQGIYRAGDRLDRIGANDPRTVELNNVGAFAQVTASPFRALPDLRLTGNLRWDLPDLYDPQLSWRAAASYNFGKAVTAKIIAGRAFQAPSSVLLFGQGGFGNANNVIGSRVVAGGGTLNPQTATSIEAVVVANILDRIALDSAVYWQEVADKIQFSQLGSNFRALNQGAVQYVGAEARLRASFPRASPYLQLAYQRPLGDEPMPLYPNVTGRAGVDLTLVEARLKANVQVRGASARDASESNVLLNNGRQYQLPAWYAADVSVLTDPLALIDGEHPTTFSLAVRNVLDARWAEPSFGGFDLPSFGRTAMLEVRQQF